MDPPEMLELAARRARVINVWAKTMTVAFKLGYVRMGVR